jgi:hypothetical protein
MSRRANLVRFVLAAGAGAAGLAAFAPTTFGEGGRDGTGAYAAMRQDWEMRQGMRPSAYRSEPPINFLPTERLRPIPPPAPTTDVAARRQRYICARLCDGAQLVLGFGGTGTGEDDYADMCAAAGGEAETALLTTELDGSRARLDDRRGREFASAAELIADLRTKGRPGQCPAAVAEASFSVPIEADTTLKAGDVVATAEGFKVFVGRAGSAPHKEASFVHVDDARRLAPEVRRLLGKMKIAEGG